MVPVRPLLISQLISENRAGRGITDVMQRCDF